MDPLKGIKLDQPLRGFFERLSVRVNASATKVPTAITNNVYVVGPGGDLKDSGVPIPPTGNFVDRDYVGERFLTDSPLPEAGEEAGSRHGSFRIGLLTDDDYAYFDENGKLILYGVAGVQLITPVNATTTPPMFAVLDVDGNLKYRTKAQLIGDLYSDIAADIEKWVSEHFITESEIPEAEVTDTPFVYSELVADDGFFLLPEITNCGFGTVTIASGGVIEASAEFEIDSAGTVDLIRSTANIAVNIAAPGTDAAFNIGIGTVNPVICKNRLGGHRRPLFRLWYN